MGEIIEWIGFFVIAMSLPAGIFVLSGIQGFLLAMC